MANYFVKKTGNDGNSGATWALAKATVQAAMGLTSPGDTIYIAPGVYRESLTAPNSDTVTFHGDPWGTVADGGGNYHGVTAGFIHLEPAASAALFAFATNYNGHTFKYLWLSAQYGRHTAGTALFNFNAGNAINGITFSRCIISPAASTINIASTYTANFEDCLMFGSQTQTLLVKQNEASFAAAQGKMKFTRCVFIGGGTFGANKTIIYSNGAINAYTYPSFTDCLSINFGLAGTANNTLVQGAGNIYNRFDATRTRHIGGEIYYLMDTGGTHSGNYYHNAAAGGISGWTATTVIPTLVAPVLGVGLPINDVLSAFTRASADLMGASTSSNQTPGPVEYQDAFTRLFGPGYRNSVASTLTNKGL